MSIFPVISRELRAQCRQPFTHWLRVIGAAAILLALLKTFWAYSQVLKSGMPLSDKGMLGAFGAALFGSLQRAIFFVIWIVVPLSMADMISRERREGTLSLLYLTKLHSFGIVVGKAFVHVVRSFSLFLTMIPWLMLPVLFGGVDLYEISLAVLLSFAALVFATSAGLIASTISKDWLVSVILAEVFAMLLLLIMLQLHGSVLRGAIKANFAPPPWAATGWRGGPSDPLDEIYGYHRGRGVVEKSAFLLQLTAGAPADFRLYRQPFFMGRPEGQTSWQMLTAGLTPTGKQAWRRGVMRIVAAAALSLLIAIGFASCYLQRTWRDRVASLRYLKLKEKFLRPRFGVGLLRTRLASSLSSNPIGWLQLYSPSARLVKWGWCLLVIVAQVLLSGDPSDLYSIQNMLGLLLLLGLAFSATGSFRRELETGAFELLLVTPIREGQIIFGRLRGLWQQFLPAVGIYAAGNLYLASGWRGSNLLRDTQASLTLIVLAFCTLPVVGLFFSIKRLNFFVAWGFACLVGLGPMILGPILESSHLFTILVQFSFAITAGILLFRTLRSHSFRASL